MDKNLSEKPAAPKSQVPAKDVKSSASVNSDVKTRKKRAVITAPPNMPHGMQRDKNVQFSVSEKNRTVPKVHEKEQMGNSGSSQAVEVTPVPVKEENQSENPKEDSVKDVEVIEPEIEKKEIGMTRSIIRVPIVCPPGMRPDRNGICRKIF